MQTERNRVAARALVALATMAAGLVVGCGAGDAVEPAVVRAEAPLGRGSLRCEVRLVGEAPDAPLIVADKNVEHCGAELRDPVLRVQGGRIADAVVSVDPGEQVAAGEALHLDLRSAGCLLEPRVQTAPVGSRLLLTNRDNITHNPHGWLDGERTVFNVTLVDEGVSLERTLRDAGVYRIDCDTHSWMRAFIHVFDHPFHGVTGSEGEVRIDGLPAGPREVVIWHEVLGSRRIQVQIEPGRETAVVVEFEAIDTRSVELTPPGMEPWIARMDPLELQEDHN
ncbi:cupredoxin domain-containing protein [Engelhardtia mirabilis]|uniref:Uncharacterized protein n=1 Tax=Engelhardtia mirabilis TaxID=2528011 RepID=A0A518BJ19_9BACT|nr:hypothetical protein Pla133_20310 [Planctomycetes bacterium Pla133]QDV01283.1 hypothetical protein Pla86_20320 [Planctomycetes bacterium Pla86]